MQYINGIRIAKEIREELKNENLKIKADPHLSVFLIGEDPASMIYVKKKQEAADEIGIKFSKYTFHEETNEEIIIDKIRELNEDSNTHGILIQLPLPKWFNTNKIIEQINPAKDVDGFHPKNLQKIAKGKATLIPPVATAIMKVLEATKVDLEDKTVIILSNSEIFNQPLEFLLNKQGVKLIKIPPSDHQIKNYAQKADVLIAARGAPKMVKPDMVKDGAILVDVGITRLEGRIIGDIDPTAHKKASFVSPVPGGVGPVTVAMLLKNVLIATKEQSE